MGKGGDTILNRNMMALCSLEQEVANIAKNSFDQGRDHLDDLEIKHLLKMTDHVVMKIKKQIMESAL